MSMLNLNGVNNSEGSEFKVINGGNPGFCEPMTLKSVETGTNDAGCTFILFSFVDSTGAELKAYEWAVDMNRENAQNQVDSQMKRLKHIVTKLVPEGIVLPSAGSFSDLYSALVNLINSSSMKGTQLRGKLVYNNKGFLSFPKYVPFLEPASVAIADTRLSIRSEADGGIDKMVKPVADMSSAAGIPSVLMGGSAEDLKPF